MTTTMIKKAENNFWAVVTFEVVASTVAIDCGAHATRTTTRYALVETMQINKGESVFSETQKKIALGMGYTKEMATQVMLERAAKLSAEMGYVAV